MSLSRRTFIQVTAGAAIAPRALGARQRAVTASDIADRIRANVGVPWRETTVDGIKAGDTTTVVTGVATTVMATLDVLRRAAAAKQNFIITHEPVFYSANDVPGPRANDPVYLAKKAFIDEQRLVVWRFVDHWNARRPHESAKALASALGWTPTASSDVDQIYQTPDTTLGALAADVRTRLGVRGGIRTVGRSDMRVRSAFLSPGTTTVPATVAGLARADVIISGEPREWEAVPYTRDTWSTGQPKGMVALGRLVSEAPGMQACAAWLQTFLPEVPVQSIAIADPVLEPVGMTAQEVIARVQQQLSSQGIAWRAQTVDTFKAGSPSTEVRGIATTGMATLDVLHRASALGRNFVIAHEPTFYNHLDQTTDLESNPIYQAKQRFIAERQMVVFRFHDHAHALQPDPLVAGSARMLGWTEYALPQPRLYQVPETTLGALARDAARRLGAGAIRIVGNPDMKVRRIALGPGSGVPALSPDVDLAVGGETAEAGGNAEYALDAEALGQSKAVMLLGHMMSEDWGMQEVAMWLRTFLTEVAIEWVPAGEPFAPPQ